MSTFVISDIHGCDKAFKNALKRLSFTKKDRLFILGDMIDRGFDSKGVLDTIFLLQDSGYNIKCIKGNHEQMFLDSLTNFNQELNWLRNGGKETLSSFFTSDIHKIPKKYIDFLSSLESSYIYENFIFVHAGINMKATSPLDDESALLWLRDWKDYFDKDWLGERIVIHGHTPFSQNEILNQINTRERIVCIDNGSYMNTTGYGSICVLSLETFQVSFIN